MGLMLGIIGSLSSRTMERLGGGWGRGTNKQKTESVTNQCEQMSRV